MYYLYIVHLFHIFKFYTQPSILCHCCLVQFRLNESDVCETCTSWQIDSGVTWGQEHFSRGCYIFPVGNWNSKTGLKLTEPLFLHLAYGFRGIALPIATFHVSNRIKSYLNIEYLYRQS